jgi:hypothetical protein
MAPRSLSEAATEPAPRDELSASHHYSSALLEIRQARACWRAAICTEIIHLRKGDKQKRRQESARPERPKDEARLHSPHARHCKYAVGGTLATAGGLVFTGEANGRFSAYDASTGKVLWTQQTGTGVGAPPMSYMANGRQFIAVATGAARGGGGLRPGGAIRAFALPAR